MEPAYVVSSVRVVVDTTEERCGRILANHLGDEVTTTGMLVHERADVVNETGDNNQRALHRLLLD